MAEVVSEIYEDVRPTTFEIVHEQNRLKSEYVCYADFECESWLWKKKPVELDSGGSAW